VNAIERRPNVAIFHYNLACYMCQLGELEKAKVRLHRAFKLDPGLRVMALDDEELKPLWDEIAAGWEGLARSMLFLGSVLCP
jgi:hypothetical protein